MRLWLWCATLTCLASSSDPASIQVDRSLCLPNALDAPFDLGLSRYEGIIYATRDEYQLLIEADCSTANLAALFDCDLVELKDIKKQLATLSASCSKQLHSSISSIYYSLVDHGCMDEWSHDYTEAARAYAIIATVNALNAETTCHAIVMSARLAFNDALHGKLMQRPLSVDSSLESVPITDLDPAVVPMPVQAEFVPEKPADGGEANSGHSLWAALIAGALAGLAVDLTLFPLDTIKTRLQSSAGFKAAGGLKGLYQGIGSIALGSAPSSALFFLAYEFAGKRLQANIVNAFIGHLLATTIGELAASIARVPADVVKSRQQVELSDGIVQSTTLWMAIRKVYVQGESRSIVSRLLSFYAGWLSTIVREIPFGCIQFPLFSYLKDLAGGGSDEPLSMSYTVICGIIAGATAGSLTTPLDVVKTRIMLAEHEDASIRRVFFTILRTEGLRGLFRGMIPRTLWIGLGGAIFLGGYDGFARLLDA